MRARRLTTVASRRAGQVSVDSRLRGTEGLNLVLTLAVIEGESLLSAAETLGPSLAQMTVRGNYWRFRLTL